MSSAGLVFDGAALGGPYAERNDAPLGWLDEAGARAAGALTRRLGARLDRARKVAAAAEALGPALADLDDAGVAALAGELRAALRSRGFADELVARCFALVREAARRHLGQRHHDVQLLGGWVLLHGMVAEMETGEGKTLTATLAAGTAALAGLPVHVITVNDYLVGRDAEAMGPVYRALGLTVGVVQHGLPDARRRQAYACDVAYCSNKELAFDYLRDRLVLGRVRTRVRLELERLAHGRSRADRLVLRGLCFGIVDEADSVLVDEARTPLVISGGGHFDEFEEQVYETAVALARQLAAERDFAIDARDRRVRLTPEGVARLEALSAELGGIWNGPNRRGELVAQALVALHAFERDKHYLVADDKVRIVDEYTGRVMADRTWQRGLHQMIEVKEGCPVSGSNEPLAQISYQRFFRRFRRLAGMSGTATEVAGELWSVYRMPVVRVPTHRPMARRDLGSRVFASEAAKWGAVVARVREMHAAGRPVLVGTRSVAASEKLSALLGEIGIEHRVLNARQDQEEAEIVAGAGAPQRVTVATNMAGRGTDIRLAPEARAAGGLHVIATERHEARRIDRQLFGRCGRQGDPGSFELVTSLEDDLVLAHGRALAALVGGGGDEPAAVASRRRALVARAAQLRAERLHASARRALLRMDERVANLLAFSGRGE